MLTNKKESANLLQPENHENQQNGHKQEQTSQVKVISKTNKCIGIDIRNESGTYHEENVNKSLKENKGNEGRKPYETLNYSWPNDEQLKKYKRTASDRFNEAALSLRQVSKIDNENPPLSIYLEHLFCIIFLAIPRIILIAISLIFVFIFGNLSLLGLPKPTKPYEQPKLHGIRLFLRNCAGVFCRLTYFALGVYWVNIKGKRASQKEAPIRVYAPHTSYLDSLLHTDWPLSDQCTPVVSAEFVRSLSFIMIVEPIWVETKPIEDTQGSLPGITPNGTGPNVPLKNNDPEQARKGLVDIIKARCAFNPDPKKGETRRWDPIMMNPEGMCSSSACLNTFKIGAFVAGAPVQPVYIEYPSDCNMYLWEPIYKDRYNGGLGNFLKNLTRFRCRITYHYLPVYKPNEEEIKDPQLFAYNVRKKLSEYSGLPCVDTTVEDVRILERASIKYDYDPNYAIIEFNRLKKSYQTNLKEIKEFMDEYLAKFKDVFEDRKMEVTVEEYSRKSGEPIDYLVEDFFKDLPYFDRNYVNMPTVVESKIRKRWRDSGREGVVEAKINQID